MPPTTHSVTPEDKSAKKQAPKPNQQSLAPDAAPIVQRQGMDISRLQPNQVLSLQRSIGNRAVQKLVSSSRGPVIQAKLQVGPAGDRYEQEADRVAAEVTKSSASKQDVQKKADETVQRDHMEEEEED